MLQDQHRRCFDGQLIGTNFEIWIFGGFIGVVNARKTLDESCSGFLVQAFYIAGFAYFNGGIDVYFDEIFSANNGACQIAHFPAGADERVDANDPGMEVKFGNFSNAPDVFQAVFRAKAQVVVDAKADVVAIEYLRKVSFFKQQAFEVFGNGAFSRTRQTRQPQYLTPLVQACFALLSLHELIKYWMNMLCQGLLFFTLFG